MDYYVGEIRTFAGNFAPVGWHLCDGSTLPSNQYQALFSLLGAKYGGDGRTTFGLPNLIGNVVVGTGQLAGGSNYTLGQTGGVTQVALTEAQLPSHNHPLVVSTAAATTSDPTGNFYAVTSGDAYPNVTLYVPDLSPVTAPPSVVPNAQLDPAAVNNTGGNAPHNNIMPNLGIVYIIALQGLYPQS